MSYGVDLSRFSLRPIRNTRCDGPLRVLFVGRISLMKGIPYLLTALAELGPTQVQARLIGSLSVDNRKLERFQSVATFMRHTPRSDMLNQILMGGRILFSLDHGRFSRCYLRGAGLRLRRHHHTKNACSIGRDGVDGYRSAPTSPWPLPSRATMMIGNCSRDITLKQRGAAYARGGFVTETIWSN